MAARAHGVAGAAVPAATGGDEKRGKSGGSAAGHCTDTTCTLARGARLGRWRLNPARRAWIRLAALGSDGGAGRPV